MLPNLLSHINRVKKRNELRAEIKRTHHTDKEVEEEEEDEDQESVPDKEQEDKKEKDKDAMEEEVPAESKTVTYNSPEFEKLVFSPNSCEITVKVALSLKKFLMTKVIEKLMATTVMKEIQGISGVVVL